MAEHACWRMYVEVLARRISPRAAPLDQGPVDAYAVPHPDIPPPVQSVGAHAPDLPGLMFEQGTPSQGSAEQVRRERVRATAAANQLSFAATGDRRPSTPWLISSRPG
jgi:hypothetical protein